MTDTDTPPTDAESERKTISVDPAVYERLRRAKKADETWTEAVDRVLDVYDAARIEGYHELGVDPFPGDDDDRDGGGKVVAPR